MKLVEFTLGYAQLWDNFILNCPMATFLCSQKFLAYHGEKFQDKSLLIYSDDNNLIGIFPAAVNPNDHNMIVSHPGITYGGVLHQGKLIGTDMINALGLIINHYASQGYCELIYKAIPYFYHLVPSSDDLYALFFHKANLYRRDLSCTIDLREPSILSNKSNATMRRRLKKAEANNISVSFDQIYLAEFWEILTQNLAEKYNTKPVHSLSEIQFLINRFPEQIQVYTSIFAGKVVAGTLIFITNRVMHTQYLVVTHEGMENFALDFVIQSCIAKAREQNFRYFDFGISSENQGLHLNQSLYHSKAKHGGAGTAHDFYKLSLN